MELSEKLEKIAKIKALKYVISKQMFCPYTNEILDYRNAIMIEIKDVFGDTDTRVVSGKFINKIDDIRKAFESKGVEVDIFINTKK